MPSAIDTPPPRCGESFGLPLAAQVCFEFGKDAKHVEERLAGSGRGIRGLLSRGDVGVPLPELRDNDLEILL